MDSVDVRGAVTLYRTVCKILIVHPECVFVGVPASRISWFVVLREDWPEEVPLTCTHFFARIDLGAEHRCDMKLQGPFILADG
jgi:hypothetical protein